MTRLILALVAVLGLSELAPAKAQFGFGHHRFGYGGYSFSYRSGFGGPSYRFGGFSGGFITRSAYFYRPIGFGPFGTFGGFGPYGLYRPYGFYRVSAFGPFGFGPFNPFGLGFGNPFWGGWGPGLGFAGGFGGFAPPVVAVPVPVPVAVAEKPDSDPEPIPLPLPGAEAPMLPKGNFLVIAPRPEQTNPPVPRVVAKPKLPPPAAFDPFKAPAKVKAEVAEADPKKEAARLVKLGRLSFAAGDYGRAAENFARAIASNPDDAKAYFLLAQAKFAAGQYAEAVAQIRAGLARDPTWPASAFDPTELYGDRPERFVLHLLALKKALNDNPNQATLEFLLGYQLWFGGDKAEADKLFRAAEKRLAKPGPIALFKLP